MRVAKANESRIDTCFNSEIASAYADYRGGAVGRLDAYQTTQTAWLVLQPCANDRFD